MDINEYLEKYRKETDTPIRSIIMMLDPRPRIVCADGLTLSVQASAMYYCTPRTNYGPYSAVEVGYPSEAVERLMPYAENPDKPTDTVYGYVPVHIVEQIIEEHGGIAETKGE